MLSFGGARRAERGERGSSDMDRGEQDLLKTEPVAEEGEDAVAMLSAPETLTEEEQEELRRELTKVEEEIQTLSQVLAAKEKHLAEIKRKLGITSLQELKQNIAKGWQDVTATNAYKKTFETLSQAGQKACAAFSSVGSVITKKLEDVKNSPTFKSFEEKVENLKSKVGGAKPAGGDFGEVLNSTANAPVPQTRSHLQNRRQRAPELQTCVLLPTARCWESQAHLDSAHDCRFLPDVLSFSFTYFFDQIVCE